MPFLSKWRSTARSGPILGSGHELVAIDGEHVGVVHHAPYVLVGRVEHFDRFAPGQAAVADKSNEISAAQVLGEIAADLGVAPERFQPPDKTILGNALLRECGQRDRQMPKPGAR